MSEKEKVVLWRTEDEPGHPEWWTSRPVDDPEAEFRGDEPVKYIAVPAASDPVPALEADLVALRAERDGLLRLLRDVAPSIERDGYKAPVVDPKVWALVVHVGGA